MYNDAWVKQATHTTLSCMLQRLVVDKWNRDKAFAEAVDVLNKIYGTYGLKLFWLVMQRAGVRLDRAKMTAALVGSRRYVLEEEIVCVVITAFGLYLYEKSWPEEAINLMNKRI